MFDLCIYCLCEIYIFVDLVPISGKCIRFFIITSASILSFLVHRYVIPPRKRLHKSRPPRILRYLKPHSNTAHVHDFVVCFRARTTSTGSMQRVTMARLLQTMYLLYEVSGTQTLCDYVDESNVLYEALMFSAEHKQIK